MRVLCVKPRPGIDYLTEGKVYRAHAPLGNWFHVWDDEGDELECRIHGCRFAEWKVLGLRGLVQRVRNLW